VLAFNPGRMVPAYDDLLSRMVADVMTAEFIYVDPVTKLTRVLQLMVDHRMKSIPVLDAERLLVGIIARRDTSCVRWPTVHADNRACSRGPRRSLLCAYPVFAVSTSSGDSRYIPDMVSTQHRWS
jgi:CBS-domain-containing membrane protein